MPIAEAALLSAQTLSMRHQIPDNFVVSHGDEFCI
jgi:hypothetical protein